MFHISIHQNARSNKIVVLSQLMASMQRIQETETNPNLITGKVISLLEGGYDTSPFTLGLAKCVDAHVIALQEG